jgi:hypothetical protein
MKEVFSGRPASLRSRRHLRSFAAIVLTVWFVLPSSAGYGDETHYLGHRGESQKALKRGYRETKKAEGEEQEWQVYFRAMSGQFTVLEKRAGYNNWTSLRFYAQFRKGTLYPIDADEYDHRAGRVGKGGYPIYLPRGLDSIVMKKTARTGGLLSQLKDGDRITVTGRLKESRYVQDMRVLKGFVNVADEVERGWEQDDPETDPDGVD